MRSPRTKPASTRLARRAVATANEVGALTATIDEKPANLNDYGLGAPRIEVDFKATGDKDFRTLLIGQKTPTGGNLFAKKKGEDKVFLIAGFQEPTFNRGTFELRDKAVYVEITSSDKPTETGGVGGAA